jgi:hypothetical protein
MVAAQEELLVAKALPVPSSSSGTTSARSA